jgi:hypothetical protein
MLGGSEHDAQIAQYDVTQRLWHCASKGVISQSYVYSTSHKQKRAIQQLGSNSSCKYGTLLRVALCLALPAQPTSCSAPHPPHITWLYTLHTAQVLSTLLAWLSECNCMMQPRVFTVHTCQGAVAMHTKMNAFASSRQHHRTDKHGRHASGKVIILAYGNTHAPQM